MTECNQSSFGFEACGSRDIVARFDGGTISSDGGSLLLRETDRRLNLLARLAGCFLDARNQDLVEHSVLEMVSQRVYGLALGYEDLNDHEQLRTDPLFGILCARLRESNHDASFGCVAEIARIVAQIRGVWPAVRIILRGDSGFCRNELMSWCEDHAVDFVFGLARNQRLRRIIGAQMQAATQ